MCMILLLVIAVLAVLGAMGDAWPILPAVVGIFLAWRAWEVYTERANAAREQEAQRAHAAKVGEHRNAATYWRGQLAELEADTPQVRQFAENSVIYHEARLREMGAGTETTE